MACAAALVGANVPSVHPSRAALRTLIIVFVAPLFSSALVAQSILVTDHRGKLYPVVAAKNARPIIEIDGKRVRGDGLKFALRKVTEFLPVFVSVRNLKVHSSSLNLVESGNQINNEFHFRAEFESPYSLEDVFLVLELSSENEGKSLFLYEIGRLKANHARPLTLTARMSYALGPGNFRFHLFSGGLQILHSEQPFAMREQMLDRLIARRIKERPDGPPAVFFGPTPEYPAKLGKAKTPGEVVMRVRIRPTGAVLDATVVSATEPAMGESALAAIRQWRFLPKIKNGRPVETEATIPIAFSPRATTAPEE